MVFTKLCGSTTRKYSKLTNNVECELDDDYSSLIDNDSCSDSDLESDDE